MPPSPISAISSPPPIMKPPPRPPKPSPPSPSKSPPACAGPSQSPSPSPINLRFKIVALSQWVLNPFSLSRARNARLVALQPQHSLGIYGTMAPSYLELQNTRCNQGWLCAPEAGPASPLKVGFLPRAATLASLPSPRAPGPEALCGVLRLRAPPRSR